MSIDWKDIENILEEKLAEVKVLLLGIFLLVIGCVFIDTFLSQYIETDNYRGLLYLIALIFWLGYWLHNRFYLPRKTKNKIGIVISIYSENEKERQKLKADFITKLKTNFRDEGILEFAEIIFLKNHFAKEICESDNPQENIDKKNLKIKAHFYVYGNIKKRPNGNSEELYYLNLNGYVYHKPTSKSINQEISNDFTKVLPKEINFGEKSSFKGFEVSANIVHQAIRYILGIAAFVSQEPILAFRLHDGLKEQFKNINIGFSHEIINRISLLLSDEALWISKYNFYRGTNNLEETKRYLNISIRENENNYGTWLFKAILDFIVDQDADEAIKSIERAKRYTLNTFEWRYSEAFLYFWKGKYDKALSICQKIKNKNYIGEETSLKEVRDFNTSLLETNSGKPQLYFWMGYLSYFKEHNLGNALQDFENFEVNADSSMSSLLQKSHAYILEIKHRIGIN